MKRRLKSNSGYPLTTAGGEIARNGGFEKPFDTRTAKRVRFEDIEIKGTPIFASPRRREATQSPKYGAPKTSEYAYFRKVKEGAFSGRSYALHKQNEQLASSKINYFTRETSIASDKIKPGMTDLINFSVSRERAGPSDQNLFLSPRVSKYDEPEQIRSKELTNKIKRRSALLSENVTPIQKNLFSSPINVSLENSENQCSEKGIFSAKRHRLRQWVAHASFSEVEKLHPKGFDLVSLLLSRLLPKGNENCDSSKGDADNSSKSLKFDKSNNLEKGLHLFHKRDWDKYLPKICSGRSSDIVFIGRDSFVSGFPFNYRKESHLQDESMDPAQHSRRRGCRSCCTHYDFSFCLPFESHRPSSSFHFKDLDEFGSKIERGREPHRILLEWDLELGKDRVDSPIINHSIEKNVCARLADFRNVDQQTIVDDVLEAKASCPSSLFSNCYLGFNPSPNCCSTGWLMPDARPNFDDVKCAEAQPGQFSLAIPYTPKCITLAEDRNGENILSNSNTIFSYRDQNWLKHKVWVGKSPSEFRWKCLSATDFYSEDHPSVFHAW